MDPNEINRRRTFIREQKNAFMSMYLQLCDMEKMLDRMVEENQHDE